MRRREFIAALGGVAAWPMIAQGQQPSCVRRVGMLNFSDGKDEVAQFFVKDLRKSLGDLGWNIELDVQWGGGGERGRANAEQLMTRTPDAIVANGTAMLVAAQQVTRSVPIVFFNVSDPVGGGLIQSMSRPGGNSTGFTNYEDALGWQVAGNTQGSNTKSETRICDARPTKPSLGWAAEIAQIGGNSFGGTACACRGARTTRYSKQHRRRPRPTERRLCHNAERHRCGAAPDNSRP
jgi:hypothetical protein